jgi:hypothetical protein
MHNLPIGFLAVCFVTTLVLQGLSILIANIEIAAKQIEARATWVAPDGSVFEEFVVGHAEGSEATLQREFDQPRSEVLLAGHLSHANG